MLFPGDPGDKPRLVDYAPIGAPLPLMDSRGEKDKSSPCAGGARMRAFGCLKLWIGIERDGATYSASYAGLTRVSIALSKKSLAKRTDCRVKPGNDEGGGKKSRFPDAVRHS
jgi:hypothetical protein